MPDKTRLTRRAALGLIGAGGLVTVADTLGFTRIAADRLANLDVASDPNAYLGLDGIGTDPQDQVDVSNNASGSDLRVTVSTNNFTIENTGGNRTYQFTLSPSAPPQTVNFYQADGNQDTVQFTGELLDDAGDVVGTIDLTRTITIPVDSGSGSGSSTTYHVRNYYSDLFMTVESSGGSGNPNDPRNVFQRATNGPLSEWKVIDNGDGTVRLQNQYTVSRGSNSGEKLVLSIDQNPSPGDNTVSLVARPWAGTDDQKWNLNVDSEGRYLIESVANPSEVADVENDATWSGADIISWPREPVDDADPGNQRWIFESV